MPRRKNPFRLDSLDGQIWDALYSYPSLYKDGGAVLSHMYTGYGNGYEWIGGKLLYAISDRGASNINEKPLECEANAPDSLRYQFVTDRLRRISDAKFVRKNAELLTKDRFREWGSLYPLSEYSKLANVPDAVTDDFLAGARLAIDLSYGVLSRRGCILFHVDSKNVKQMHDRTESCIRVLDSALKGIVERFGANPLGAKKTGYLLWNSFVEYVVFHKKSNAEFAKTLRGLIR